MNKLNSHAMRPFSGVRRGAPSVQVVLSLSLLIATGFGCAATSHAGPLTPSVSTPDAVIEVWEQQWTLQPDGATEYYEKQHVRLNNDRAYGEFCDPRITYNADTDQLDIVAARVKLADETYRELPDYAHVFVSPGESAGWPAFAAIHQHLLVMGGIEPGCVVELEYRIKSPSGTKPALAADVRLDHEYPVQQHVVRVRTPRGASFSAHLEQGAAQVTHNETDANGVVERTWTCDALPAAPHEPQTPPWQTDHPRLAFSTVGTADAWAKAVLARMDTAAAGSELITKLATEWTKDARTPADKLRALQEKLSATFNFVNFPLTWQPATPRPASQIADCCYGLPQEAAALLLALARAAELPVRPGLLCADHVFLSDAPQDGMIANYVVVLDGETPGIWDAHSGRITRNDHWAGYTLTMLDGDKAQRVTLPAWTNADDSRCELRGKVTLKDDGTFTGDVELRTTGLFVSPEDLRTSDAQKGRINSLLRHLLPDAKVEKFAVEKLADNEFVVSASIKSSEALEKAAGCFELSLAEDGPYATEVHLPLEAAQRENAVWLTGPFDEQIELVVEWPEVWTVEVQPGDVAVVSGDWGTVGQSVTTDGHSLTVRRHTRITRRELPAADLLVLRNPFNELRSAYARTLLLKPR